MIFSLHFYITPISDSDIVTVVPNYLITSNHANTNYFITIAIAAIAIAIAIMIEYCTLQGGNKGITRGEKENRRRERKEERGRGKRKKSDSSSLNLFTCAYELVLL